MNESLVVLLFDYLVSTRIGNMLSVLIGALILYGIFRLIIKIIDYFVLRRLINKILQAVDDEEDDDYNSILPSSNHEDERSQKKDKKRDQIYEAEKLQNLENDFIGNKSNYKQNKRIIGVAKPVGKWTARVMKQWLQKHRHMDIDDINNLGYFRASVIAERKSQGFDINYSNKRNNGGMSR